MKKVNKYYTVLVFLFLYLPMLVLMVASFNTGKDVTEFEGFTFNRYVELFHDDTLLPLLGNSLKLALISSGIATLMGTAAAIGICRMRPRMRNFVLQVTNIPMTNPDIVTGVSLSLLFVFFGQLMRRNAVLGFGTMLITHITFNLPYVILNVMPKIRQLDPALNEAALDLGCTPLQAFFKCGRPGFSPWVGKISCMRHGNLLQYSCPDNPMDRGAWKATIPGITKNQTRLGI